MRAGGPTALSAEQVGGRLPVRKVRDGAVAELPYAATQAPLQLLASPDRPRRLLLASWR